MIYYIPSTKEVINLYQTLRYRFPNISIPNNVNIPELGVFILHQLEIPEYDPFTQDIEVDEIKLESDGKYYQTWKVVPLITTEVT